MKIQNVRLDQTLKLICPAYRFLEDRKDGDVLNILIYLTKNGRNRQHEILRGFNEKQILVASPLWGLGLWKHWLP